MRLMEEIDVLREHLNFLVKEKRGLCENEIIECSQKLDMLISQYYQKIEKYKI